MALKDFCSWRMHLAVKFFLERIVDNLWKNFTEQTILIFGSLALFLVIFWGNIEMEVDATFEHDNMRTYGMDNLFSELANAIPRIDEAMSFAEMLRLNSVNKLKKHRGFGAAVSWVDAPGIIT
ncbi:unnamed protein product [Prunus armeniaca]|uniref:Uncharacterized protein n=1 Tax=Prunus armeniaca TaxID=36596 RepID=A0A6J5VY29_PRUAR|nr:unnamed protein product [Prunus armeniaca]